MKQNIRLLPFLGAILLLPSFASASTMRPAVGKHLLQAESLLQAQKYDAALREVNAASATGNLSETESLAIAQLRGAAASGAGQYVLAAQSYQLVLASNTKPHDTQLQLMQAVAGFYDHAGDYKQTIFWVGKYVKAGGTDEQTRVLTAQADYLQGHYKDTVVDVARDDTAAKQTGKTLPENELQLAANAAEKTGNTQAYFQYLQALLITYPNKTYWNAAIALVQDEPGFPDSLVLDADRLRFATGTLTQPADYEDYAERAILAARPEEAKRVLDTGFANGILTAQTDAGHAARLRSLTQKDNTQPQGAPEPPLDRAIAAAQAKNISVAQEKLKSVPGYDAATPADSLAAMARLWEIEIISAPDSQSNSHPHASPQSANS